jgi:hypothetical protein
MDPATASIVIALIGLALEKGIPAATQLMQNWNKEEISLEDIQALRDLVKPPEEY